MARLVRTPRPNRGDKQTWIGTIRPEMRSTAPADGEDTVRGNEEFERSNSKCRSRTARCAAVATHPRPTRTGFRAVIVDAAVTGKRATTRRPLQRVAEQQRQPLMEQQQRPRPQRLVEQQRQPLVEQQQRSRSSCLSRSPRPTRITAGTSSTPTTATASVRGARRWLSSC